MDQPPARIHLDLVNSETRRKHAQADTDLAAVIGPEMAIQPHLAGCADRDPLPECPRLHDLFEDGFHNLPDLR